MTFNLTKKKVGDCIDVTDFVANGSFASLKANVQYLDNASPDKFAVLVRTLDFNRNWNGEYVWVDKAAYHFLKKSSLIQGDLVLCNVGSVGIVFEVPDLGLPMTLGPNSVLCRTKDRNIIRQRFIYYYFLSSVGQALLEELSGGSTVQPKFNKTVLRNSEIDIPDLAHQDFIVHTLGILDSKISTNAAISKTLEDIAQTLFKSWFIDFDPVKEKMAGEKPAGMDAATAALFPDSMVESELGLIPRGWELKKVEEVLKRITVKGLPKSTVLLNLGRTLVLEQGDSVIAGFIDEDADVEATKDSPAFVFGDHTCRMRISTIPFSIFPNTIVLTSELIDTYWAFGATWGLQKFETYRRHWMELAYKVLIVPNTEIANVYGEQVKPLFEIIDSLMVQNRVLSALRDDLLPRLISGELQIPEEMLAS